MYRVFFCLILLLAAACSSPPEAPQIETETITITVNRGETVSFQDGDKVTFEGNPDDHYFEPVSGDRHGLSFCGGLKGTYEWYWGGARPGQGGLQDNCFVVRNISPTEPIGSMRLRGKDIPVTFTVERQVP